MKSYGKPRMYGYCGEIYGRSIPANSLYEIILFLLKMRHKLDKGTKIYVFRKTRYSTVGEKHIILKEDMYLAGGNRIRINGKVYSGRIPPKYYLSEPIYR